ncbi:MAG: hypothetical protein OER90_10340 [Gemmatimonadota bacterium]|nr:hypothetical protein [Gemmatimonadota bacterium]
MRSKHIARWAGMLAVAFLLVPLSACDEILTVDNPEEIGVGELDDNALLDAQVNGVLAAFSDNIAGDESTVIQAAAFLTDETLTGLNWEDWQRVNQRIVNYTEGPVDAIWSDQSRIVRTGEATLEKLDALSANPATDRRVALVSVLTAYGYLFIGETMCQAVFGTPDSLGTTLFTPDEIFPRAIPHFQRAITVGTAAGADDIVNLARTGLARTYLNVADFANTIAQAQQVTPGFTYWVDYSDANTDLWNNLFNEVTGSNHTIGVHPAFLNGTFGAQGLVATQTDPRIQHTSTYTTGHDASTRLYKPYQGRRYSGYTGATIASGAVEGTDVILFETNTDVMLADYNEAQHHMYEAMLRSGGAEAPVLQFVNDRRAVGNEAPVTLSGAALAAELRRQRARDTFMAGIRLGDLRRWTRQGVGDFFPSGAHPNPDRPPAVYGPWTCIPLPLEEYEGNAGLPKPANPLDPPGI